MLIISSSQTSGFNGNSDKRFGGDSTAILSNESPLNRCVALTVNLFYPDSFVDP